MLQKNILVFSFLLFSYQSWCQNSLVVKSDPGEYWWGAIVNEGEKMPFKIGYAASLYGDNKGNQTAPILLSSKGRYIWSEEPFKFEILSDKIVISETLDSIYTGQGGKTLREGFLAASKKFFPASGKMPDTLMFSKPQYNLWIELLYNQNQKDILNYAHSILDNGFPPGVIMIDSYWGSHYGNFEFRKDRFPDAKAMIEELHKLGFKVMVWICPFISPDTEIFRDALKQRILLFDNEGNKDMQWNDAKNPAIIHWWDGWSAELDFTNPKAVDWFKDRLAGIVEKYGVDGFKLDAGDMEYYPSSIVSFEKVTPNRHSELYGQFALLYSLNEYRAMWKRGGQAIGERLRDKFHTWEDLGKLVPHLTVSGLLGYQFTCPDMIGGGDFLSFIDTKIDQDLVVRSAQTHVFMPMMQFSVAPWRVLDSTHLSAVKKAVALRSKFIDYILELTYASAKSGEPFVTNMEYLFPGNGFEKVTDQFMLGNLYMVAPMVKKGTNREVVFPKGKWKSDDGSIVIGPARKQINVPLDRLPYFKLIGK